MPLSSGDPGGLLTLTALRTLVRQESDTENDNHISDTELTSYINSSRYRLYDLLIRCFGDDYYTATAQLTTDGTNAQFALPDGTLYTSAQAFYKGALVEAVSGGNIAPNSPVTLQPMGGLREKNKYQRPLSMLAAPNMFPRYRIIGAPQATNPTVTGYILFAPLPASGLVVQLWYAPKLKPLVASGDVADDFSGYLEYAVIDAAIKVKDKQERDCSVMMARLAKIEQDIQNAAVNRNMGEPNTVLMTEGEGFAPFGYGMGGFGGVSWS